MSAYTRWTTAVVLTIHLICSSSSARAQGVEEVIKVDTSMVTVNVTVTDVKGRPLMGLRGEDFLVTDEEQPVALEFFDGQGPASIVFVIDTSVSMGGSKWKNLRAGMKRFLARAREGNDYTLVSFSDAPRLVARSVTAAELWQHFDRLSPAGHTALYDGVLLGLDALGEAPRRHKALVLVSDGEDNSSRAGLSEVRRGAAERRATVYAVGILFHPQSRGQQLLDHLAAATGGLIHLPAPEGVCEALERISADVSGQYSLSYYQPDRAAGWRSVRVSVPTAVRPLKLRYQQSYLMR